MKRNVLGAALLMLCSTSCATIPARVETAKPDPAKLDSCPAALSVPPALPPLAPFVLPDGRRVVLIDTVIDRETMTAGFIIETRGAWHACRSSVVYVQEWTAALP